MIDLGLTAGIKELWEENLLHDYTVVVEDHKFHVHKVVLASVSRYFKAMLSQNFADSKMDRVEVYGFLPNIVSKLLQFIYTGDESFIVDDTIQILQCAIYLQMPLVAEHCVQNLMRQLNTDNWAQTVAVLVEYVFQDKLKEAKKFVKGNWEKVMDKYNPEMIAYEAFHVLVDSWMHTEWELFLFIETWLSCDWNSRIGYTNDLMSCVRFCLINRQKMMVIMKTDLFTKTEGHWQDLVRSACNYHQLPTHKRVLQKSKQSRLRTKPLPTFFMSTPEDNSVRFYSLSQENKWTKQEETSPIAPGIKSHGKLTCIAVDNFLIVCAECNNGEQWQIFNPRTLRWSKMADMGAPKTNFTLVHHNGKKLYALGGEVESVVTDDVQDYDFESNQWQAQYKLPNPLALPVACTLNDIMYIAGGLTDETDGAYPTDEFFSLNLSARSQSWEKKASCLWEVGGDNIGVVQREGEDVLFILNNFLKVQIYSPSQDQWSAIDNFQKPYIEYEAWIQDAAVVMKGNSLFTFNLFMETEPENEPENDSTNIGFHWEVPEEGSWMTARPVPDFPTEPLEIRHSHSRSAYSAAMMAFPPRQSDKTS